MAFYIGVFFIILGAVMVYGTAAIAKRFNITTVKGILSVKVGGLLVTILGAIIIFIAQYPERLRFLNIV